MDEETTVRVKHDGCLVGLLEILVVLFILWLVLDGGSDDHCEIYPEAGVCEWLYGGAP